jgi:hypothetical protein
MRRRIALVAIALVALGAAACGNQDDVEGSEDEPVVTGEVDQAVEIARLSLPAAVTDDVAADLIESLCAAAGSGAVAPVVAQLQASSLDPAEAPAALDALAAGAGTYCPDDVDDVVPQVQQALAPATTATTAASGVAPSGGSSSRSSSSGTGTTTGGTSNSSTGSASAGGGNASGTGNSSSTDFTQGVGSSNSSSSGGGSASGSSTTG